MCESCFRKPEKQPDSFIINTFECQHEAIAAKAAILEVARTEPSQNDWLTAEFLDGEWRITCQWKRLLKTDVAFDEYARRGKCWFSEAVALSSIWQAACKFLFDHSDNPPETKKTQNQFSVN